MIGSIYTTYCEWGREKFPDYSQLLKIVKLPMSLNNSAGTASSKTNHTHSKN